MNRNVIINLVIIGLVIGLVFGLLAFIPYVGLTALLSMFFMSAPVAVVLLIMSGKMDLTSVKDSIIQGAIAGFCSNITFCISYSIISALAFIIFNYTSNYFLTAMIIKSSVFLLLLFIIFTGVLFAVTNAFSNFCLYYIINYIRDSYERKHRE